MHPLALVFAFLCAFGAFVLSLMYLDGYWDRKRARRHQHSWGKWQTTHQVLSWGRQIGLGQTRTCDSCGSAELQTVRL